MLRLEIEGVTAAEATEYILAGLQQRRDAVQAQIDAVRQGPAPEVHPRPAKGVAKGSMSPEGKAKIVLAQKKRWARVRKEAKRLAAAAAAQTPAEAPQEAPAEVAELATA